MNLWQFLFVHCLSSLAAVSRLAAGSERTVGTEMKILCFISGEEFTFYRICRFAYVCVCSSESLSLHVDYNSSRILFPPIVMLAAFSPFLNFYFIGLSNYYLNVLKYIKQILLQSHKCLNKSHIYPVPGLPGKSLLLFSCLLVTRLGDKKDKVKIVPKVILLITDLEFKSREPGPNSFYTTWIFKVLFKIKH